MDTIRTYVSIGLEPLVGRRCAAHVAQLNASSFTGTCASLLLSKLLGLVVVAGGSIVKVPQILKIVAAGSATGINYTSYMLEMLSYLFVLAYNYRNGNPFSTYGEIFFLTLQDFVILCLINLYAAKRLRQGILLFIILPLAVALFYPQYVSVQVISQLNISALAIASIAKLSQIVTNRKNKSTGQLSAFTIFLQTGGSLARVFTTYRETADPVLLAGCVLAALLNVFISSQMIAYWNSRSTTTTTTNKSKKSVASSSRRASSPRRSKAA